jgi:hypothetical protein
MKEIREMIVVGLDQTMKTVNSLLGSGYLVKVKQYDRTKDVDNMWYIRRYKIEFDKDPKGISSLQDLDISEW